MIFRRKIWLRKFKRRLWLWFGFFLSFFRDVFDRRRMVFLEVIVLVLLILKLLFILIRFLFEFVRIVRILKRLSQRNSSTFCFAFILFCVYWFWAFIIGQWLMERFLLMVIKILFLILIADLTFIFCDFIFIFVKILSWFVWF